MFEFVFSSKVKDVISLSKSPDLLDEIERRESHEGEVENMLFSSGFLPAAQQLSLTLQRVQSVQGTFCFFSHFSLLFGSL